MLRLTLNRPQARNALSIGADEGADRRAWPRRERPAVRVVVIAGAGPAFCAGHDLRETPRRSPARDLRADSSPRCSELMLTIIPLPKPVIAEVHGVATAAGCQLVATCDLAVAAEDARFATPGVNIGLFCSTPMVALSRAVGRKAAMEMLLTGELIDAATRPRPSGSSIASCRASGCARSVDALAREDRRRNRPSPWRSARKRFIARPNSTSPPPTAMPPR